MKNVLRPSLHGQLGNLRFVVPQIGDDAGHLAPKAPKSKKKQTKNHEEKLRKR